MDPRGQYWSETGQQSHGRQDRHNFPKPTHQGRDPKYPLPPPDPRERDPKYPPPPPDPRERDRRWAHPDPYHGDYFTSPPPPRPEYIPSPYDISQYGYYGYDLPEQSRHTWGYPPNRSWEYSDNFNYYDHDFYRGQRTHLGADQWLHEDPRRPHRERTYEQEHSGNSYVEYVRYDRRPSDGSQNACAYVPPTGENGEDSSYFPGNLASSKNSGLSSSSCELSQYINGAETGDLVSQSALPSFDAEPVPRPQATAPLKYTIPHAVVSFGPAGRLIRVSPGLSAQENPARLEIHSLEVILGETPEQLEMRKFPGPLTKEDLHKVDAIEFAHQRADACLRDEALQDRSSAALLWKLLVLLCRQNGRIVGSDIAELLVQDSHSDRRWVRSAPTLIDFSEGPAPEAEPCTGEDLLTGHPTSSVADTSVQDLRKYTKLLLAGRKKEALDSAMASGLWGHALFLASKMDNRSYTTVLNRFTGQITASDPLQTLFQLLSGKTPTVSTGCGSDKWGDWKPHLAVMLSNETGDPSMRQKAIVTMGDTLASRGLIHAAHLCYLTASVTFGVFTKKAERLVLLGSSHRLPFLEFARNTAIQGTELFEYCQTLGGKYHCLPYFQVFKFLYACRLLDCGLASQAFHYCEVVGQALLRLKEPFLVLTGEVIKLADRLKLSENPLSDAPSHAPVRDPDWLQQLRSRHRSFQTGNYDYSEIYQPPVDGGSLAGQSQDFSESDLEDLSSDVLCAEAELTYHRGTEAEEIAAWRATGQTEGTSVHSQDHLRATEEWRQQANPLPPPMAAYAFPVHQVAGNQDSSYHNTDSGEIQTASQHSPLRGLPSATAGAAPSSGQGMMGAQVNAVANVDVYRRSQTIPHGMTATEKAPEAAGTEQTQSTKAGWFSGWFKSKTKNDQKENSEPNIPAQTRPSPTSRLCSAPPLAAEPNPHPLGP